MEIGSLLIAETDLAVLHTLPQLLSRQLPPIDIHLATSADETHRKLSQVRYTAAVVAPTLVGKSGSLRLHHVQGRSELIPVIVTATRADMDAARDALLYRGAFDAITKPLYPADALNSIRAALWQAQFIHLLTQRDRVLGRLERHLEAYPHEVNIRVAMESALTSVETTLTAVRSSMILLERGSDGVFFDLAVAVQEYTKDRALDRLNRLVASAG